MKTNKYCCVKTYENGYKKFNVKASNAQCENSLSFFMI